MDFPWNLHLCGISPCQRSHFYCQWSSICRWYPHVRRCLAFPSRLVDGSTWFTNPPTDQLIYPLVNEEFAIGHGHLWPVFCSKWWFVPWFFLVMSARFAECNSHKLGFTAESESQDNSAPNSSARFRCCCACASLAINHGEIQPVESWGYQLVLHWLGWKIPPGLKKHDVV